jgi:hypothetical protein
MAIADSVGLALSSILIHNLSVQGSGLEQAVQMSDSVVIHVKYFVHMASLGLASTACTPNFSRIEEDLADLQKLLTSRQTTMHLSVKCPKFVGIRWFDVVDILRLTSK